jgi:hypothetical protein
MKRYLVLLFRRPQLDPAVVPLHQQFLHRDPAHTSGGWDITVYEWLTH